MPHHLSHPAGASRIQTSHHHHLDGSALPRGALPCTLAEGAVLRSCTEQARSSCSTPPRIARRRRMHLSCCFHGANRYSPVATSRSMRPRASPSPLRFPSTIPLTCIRAFALRLTLVHCSCRPVLTCWLQGAGSHPWLHHTRLHAIWLSPNALGRGKVTTPVRLQAIPPYLA
jgi:hypothetical protein